MALVFLVEDGTGVAGATSYTTETFADDYQSLNPTTVVAWELLTSTQKQSYLMWATHLLDNIVIWEGCKLLKTNALAWPRQYVVDKEGFIVASDTIPDRVQQATAFLAVSLLTKDPTAIDDTAAFKKIKVDVIELTWRDGEFAETISPYLKNLLRGYGTVSSPGDLGFVPIVRM